MQANKEPIKPMESDPSLSEVESATRPDTRASRDAMLLCLCTACAQQFYDSVAHRIRRADHRQKYKDTCDFCIVRNGWDYIVVNTENRTQTGSHSCYTLQRAVAV